MLLQLVIAALAVLAVFVRRRFKHKTQYWTRQGVPQRESFLWPVGDTPPGSWEVLSSKKSATSSMLEAYNEQKNHKIYGHYGILGKIKCWIKLNA